MNRFFKGSPATVYSKLGNKSFMKIPNGYQNSSSGTVVRLMKPDLYEYYIKGLYSDNIFSTGHSLYTNYLKHNIEACFQKKFGLTQCAQKHRPLLPLLNRRRHNQIFY